MRLLQCIIAGSRIDKFFMPRLTQLPFNFTLHNEFTFDNFLVSDANKQLVSSFSAAVIPEQFYFIWGASGNGKSHILQATCESHSNAVYLPLRVFLDEGPEVLFGLEQLDLICIDDIHLVLEMPEWEEKLFALFNACQANGSYLIVSSLLPPLELRYYLADLQSRFKSGVSYQVYELNEAEKIEALKIRTSFAGMPLQDEVLNYICLRSDRSMHKLFSVLEKLNQLSLAEKRKVTIPLVKKYMNW